LAQLLAFTLSDFSTIFANAQAACSDATENLFAPGFTAAPPIQALPTKVSSGPLGQINTLLTAYDKRIVDDPAQIRYYATNRLLELTDDPDVKIRIKALELLGKVADVGLFADRTEITIKDKTTRDLEKELEAYFSKYVKEVEPIEEIEDAVVTEPEEEVPFDEP
jgi:hypothetical protein